MNIEVANNKLLRILRGLTDESDDTAKTLFDRIGDKWDKSVWKKEVHFNSWRDWAYGKKQLDTETVTKYDYPDFNEIGGGYGQACEWIPIALVLVGGVLSVTIVLFLIAGVIVIVIFSVRRKNKQPKSGP